MWQHAELTEEVPVDETHPRGVLDHLVLDNDTGACIPQAIINVLVELVQTSEHHIEYHPHQASASIPVPEGQPLRGSSTSPLA